MELKVIDNKGQAHGTVEFEGESLLATNASKAVLHEYTVAFLSNKREGTHKTLTRAEVSGGGIKPWKQKHTGRARSGSIRSPLWRKGGIIFGPVPRDYTISLPRKKKQLAFRLALKGLLQDDRLQVVEPIQLSEPKTKNVAAIYKKWNAPTDSILLVDKLDANFARASRNIAAVHVTDVNSFNAYDAMRARRVFVTKAALEQLTARLRTASDHGTDGPVDSPKLSKREK
jgi:large subunit ribosomal protein L4